MNEELVEMLAEFVFDMPRRDSTDEAEQIIEYLQQEGYIIIKKDQLVKEAGLIVGDKFVPDEELI